MHPVVVALLYTAVAAPAIVFNLTEELIALHHPCAARLVVLKADKTPIPKLTCPIGHMFRYNVGMYIDY
jgi:hypothetical protein